MRCTGWCNLGADPQITTSRGQEGGQVSHRAYFRAAFNHRYKSGGRDIKETVWMNCVAWGRTARQMEAARLEKGQRIYIVEGRLKQQERCDDNGNQTLAEELVVYQFAISPPKVG